MYHFRYATLGTNTYTLEIHNFTIKQKSINISLDRECLRLRLYLHTSFFLCISASPYPPTRSLSPFHRYCSLARSLSVCMNNGEKNLRLLRDVELGRLRSLARRHQLCGVVVAVAVVSFITLSLSLLPRSPPRAACYDHDDDDGPVHKQQINNVGAFKSLLSSRHVL